MNIMPAAHSDDRATAVDSCARTAVGSMLALLRAARNIQELLESSLEKVGLSPAKYQALEALVLAGGSLPLSELAGKLGCVRSNVTQMADRLEADGFVRRVDDPSDRRAILAVVTPLGVERQKAGEVAVDALQETLGARIAMEDFEPFMRVLCALQ